MALCAGLEACIFFAPEDAKAVTLEEIIQPDESQAENSLDAVPAGPKSGHVSQQKTHRKITLPEPSSMRVGPPHESILVRARRTEQMKVSLGGDLGILGKARGVDTPFNVHSYNDSLILNQQPQTLGEVLKNDPAVRTTYGYGNFSEVFVIRGFPVVSDDVSIDGLYGITPRQMVLPQLYGSVQLLTGASTLMYGAAPGGSVGGNINLLFKHAGNKPLFRMTGGYGSIGQGQGAVDMSRRFGHHKELGIRMNFAGIDGGDSIEHEGRHSVALGLDMDYRNVSNTTRLTLDMNYQNQGVTWGRPAVVLGSDVNMTPRPVGAAYNFGQKWSYEQMSYIFGLIGIEHDFTRHITAYLKFGGLSGNEAGQYDTPTLTNAQTGASTISASYIPYLQTNKSLRSGVKGDFRFGGIKNNWSFGGNALWEEADSAYAFSLTPLAGNIYHMPRFGLPAEPFIGGNPSNPQKVNSTNLYSIAFSDTAKFWRDRIAITAGFRWQQFLDKSYDYNRGGLTSHYHKGAITPAVAAIMHFSKHSSMYFNWVQGLSQGPIASGNVVNVGEVFSPYRTQQYEVGLKYEKKGFGAFIDFFRMNKANNYVDPIGDGKYRYVVNGMQQNQGIEIGINGNVLPHLRFNGGVSLIQAVQLEAGPYAGKGVLGVPNYSFNGNIEADVPWLDGATFIAGIESTGPQWANEVNTVQIPSWTILDLGVRHTFKVAAHPVTARFNVNNVTDANYWNSSYGGYLQMGMPRTFQFSLSADF